MASLKEVGSEILKVLDVNVRGHIIAHVVRAGKRRNICVSNNVSLFARAFMSTEFVMWCLSYPTISHDIQSNYTVQSYNHDKDTLLFGLKSGLVVLANCSRF